MDRREIGSYPGNKENNARLTGIPYGSYILTEISSPNRYVLSDKRYEFLIDEDGDEVFITAVNKETELHVFKKDIYGNELSGAAMQILDSKGYPTVPSISSAAFLQAVIPHASIELEVFCRLYQRIPFQW